MLRKLIPLYLLLVLISCDQIRSIRTKTQNLLLGDSDALPSPQESIAPTPTPIRAEISNKAQLHRLIQAYGQYPSSTFASKIITILDQNPKLKSEADPQLRSLLAKYQSYVEGKDREVINFLFELNSRFEQENQAVVRSLLSQAFESTGHQFLDIYFSKGLTDRCEIARIPIPSLEKESIPLFYKTRRAVVSAAPNMNNNPAYKKFLSDCIDAIDMELAKIVTATGDPKDETTEADTAF